MMTYQELLDEVYWHWRKDARGDGLKPMINYRSAILAVVELHKPTNHTYESGKQQVICSVCGWRGIELYPCPTIQAIEKELR